jgi:hypothetical protein
MQTVRDVLTSSAPPSETSAPSPASPAGIVNRNATRATSTALPSEWIERLFERLSARYGNKFAAMWAGISPEAIKREWAEGLAGFSREELVEGMRASLDREWPPNLAEFRRLCRPAPPYEVMYREAAHGRFATPVAYWAAQRFGQSGLRMKPYQGDAKALWESIVDELAAQAELPAMPDLTIPALPAPGRTYSPEKAQAAMESIRGILRRATA